MLIAAIAGIPARLARAGHHHRAANRRRPNVGRRWAAVYSPPIRLLGGLHNLKPWHSADRFIRTHRRFRRVLTQNLFIGCCVMCASFSVLLLQHSTRYGRVHSDGDLRRVLRSTRRWPCVCSMLNHRLQCRWPTLTFRGNINSSSAQRITWLMLCMLVMMRFVLWH